MRVEFDEEQGEVRAGNVRVRCTPAGHAGEVRLGGEHGPVLAPVTFGERSAAAGEALRSPERGRQLCGALRARATRRAGRDPEVPSALVDCVVLALAGSDDADAPPSFADAALGVLRATGGDLSSLLDAPAREVDRLFAALSADLAGAVDGGWTRLVLAPEAVTLSDLRDLLADGLLQRAASPARQEVGGSAVDGEAPAPDAPWRPAPANGGWPPAPAAGAHDTGRVAPGGPARGPETAGEYAGAGSDAAGDRATRRNGAAGGRPQGRVLPLTPAALRHAGPADGALPLSDGRGHPPPVPAGRGGRTAAPPSGNGRAAPPRPAWEQPHPARGGPARLLRHEPPRPARAAAPVPTHAGPPPMSSADGVGARAAGPGGWPAADAGLPAVAGAAAPTAPGSRPERWAELWPGGALAAVAALADELGAALQDEADLRGLAR